MAYFEYENFKIYYRECGEGRPLILIHGDSASSKMFMGELKFYSKNFRVIAVDLIGQGKSERVDKLPVNYWCANAEMIIALCRHIGIEKVNLLGTSGGAIVALNAVLKEADLFNKVIADSFLGEKISYEYAQEMIKDREKSEHSFKSKIFWFMMHGHDWRYVVNQNTEAIKKFAQNKGCFFEESLDDIKNEVLITGSKKDELIPDIENILKNINSKIKNSKLVLFEEGNHPAMFSNSREFRKAAVSFLSNDQ